MCLFWYFNISLGRLVVVQSLIKYWALIPSWCESAHGKIWHPSESGRHQYEGEICPWKFDEINFDPPTNKSRVLCMQPWVWPSWKLRTNRKVWVINTCKHSEQGGRRVYFWSEHAEVQQNLHLAPYISSANLTWNCKVAHEDVNRNSMFLCVFDESFSPMHVILSSAIFSCRSHLSWLEIAVVC